MVRRSPPRSRRWVAKEWRSACGVALSGSPSAPRIRSIASCTIRGDSGPPFAPTNRGPPGFQRVRAKREIVFDRLAHRRDDRRRAGLLALADDRNRLDGPDRRVGATDRQRLRNAQARAIAERQRRGVARQNPLLARLALARGGGRDGSGVRGAQGPGKAPRGLGRAHPRQAPRRFRRLLWRCDAPATARPTARAAANDPRCLPPGGARETPPDRPGRSR